MTSLHGKLRFPSPATVISLVALVFAIGGTAVAVTLDVPKHSVSLSDLKRTAAGRLLPRVAFQPGSCGIYLPTGTALVKCANVALTMPPGGARTLVIADGQIQND